MELRRRDLTVDESDDDVVVVVDVAFDTDNDDTEDDADATAAQRQRLYSGHVDRTRSPQTRFSLGRWVWIVMSVRALILVLRT